MGNFVYTEYHLSLICAFASSFRQKVFKEAPAAALTVGKPDFCFNKSFHELCLLNTWSAAPGSAEENRPNTELTYVKRSWEEIRREGFFPPLSFSEKSYCCLVWWRYSALFYLSPRREVCILLNETILKAELKPKVTQGSLSSQKV